MPISKIQSAIPEGSWKEFYVFNVMLSDGSNGKVFSKSPQLRFAVGEEVNYVRNEKGNLKLDKAGYERSNYNAPQAAPAAAAPQAPAQSSTASNAGGYKMSPDREAKIIKQSCLSSAATVFQGRQASAKEVIILAEQFVAWVNGETSAAHFTAGNDDLPF